VDDAAAAAAATTTTAAVATTTASHTSSATFATTASHTSSATAASHTSFAQRGAARRRTERAPAGSAASSADGARDGAEGARDGAMSCDGLWVPQRDVEEQLATSTALFLTAAAYGVEPHARFKDDWRLNSSIAHAPQVLALLRRVPVGVECWCYSHGVTGLRQRFRAKLVRATVQHVIVKFLADEQGRTAALCLPAPLVQVR
jgi:hypothetical protein